MLFLRKNKLQELREKTHQAIEAYEKANQKDSKIVYDNKLRELEAKKILKIMYDGSFKLNGKNDFEKLIDLTKNLMKKVKFDDVLLTSIAENTVYENENYYTTIYLGEYISHKMLLLDYLPWRKDDDDFRNFESIYRRVQENKNNNSL